MENNKNLNKLSQADLNEIETGVIEAKFKEISDKNVMALTSCYTNNFRNVNLDVLTKQLEILRERSDELHKLGMDYALKCGSEFEHPFYKSAVVTGNLARARLIEILEEVE